MQALRPLAYGWYLTLLLAVSLAAGVYYALAYLEAYRLAEFRSLLRAGVAVFILYFLVLVVRRRAYLFDPLVLLGASLFIGVILKVPYVVVNQDAREALLGERDISIFVTGTYLIAAAIAAFLAGYAPVTITRFAKTKHYRPKWSHIGVCLIGGCIVVVTLTAALLAVREIGFASVLETFSQKRFLEFDGISGRLGSSLYGYFKVALLAKIAVYLLLVYILFNTRRSGVFVFALFIVAAATAILLPLIFSARAAAVLLIIDLLVITYFSGFRINKKYALAIIGLGYAGFAFATFQRLGAESELGVIESVLAHRYLLDMTKTAQIVSFMDYADIRFYGETLIGWLFIPIPETMLSYKPMFMDMGGWIGSEVYGWKINAVPPGFVAELYMNFGWPGVIAGMAATGLLMGLFWRWFIPRIHHPVVLVFGSMLTIRFGVFLFNNDLGTFMLKNLLETLPSVLVIYACVSVRRQRRV